VNCLFVLISGIFLNLILISLQFFIVFRFFFGLMKIESSPINIYISSNVGIRLGTSFLVSVLSKNGVELLVMCV